LQASVIAKAEKNQQRNEKNKKNKKIKKTPDSVFNTVFINPDIYILKIL